MEILQQLGTAFGIGLLSGIRLYLTILGLGAAIRFHWIALESSQNGLAVLADWRVMTVAGIACAIEFVADKVPWVDSMWDSIHTFIRPVGAMILGARAFMHTDPAVQAILAILCGGLALSGHSAKAAARLAVNQSPEPFSNIALSLAGDAAVPVATWTAFHFPLLTLGFVGIFVLLFGWLAPRVWRAIHLEMAALSATITRWFNGSDEGQAPSFGTGWPLPREFQDVFRPLPETVRTKVGQARFHMGVRAAATNSLPGLNNSIGYLCVSGDQLVFVANRLFRTKRWTISVSDIASASWTAGVFLDKLYLNTPQGDFRFDVFKAAPRTQSAVSMAASAADS